MTAKDPYTCLCLLLVVCGGRGRGRGCEMMINYSFFPILSINEDVPTSYKPIFTDHSPIHAVDVYLMLLCLCCYCCPPLSPFQSASFMEWGPANGCIRHYITEPLNSQIQSLQGMCVYLHLCVRVRLCTCVCTCIVGM